MQEPKKIKTQEKQDIIAIYCNWRGFAAIQLERILNDRNNPDFDKRWTVNKLISDIPSYQKITKALAELTSINPTHIGGIVINSEISLKGRLEKTFIFKNTGVKAEDEKDYLETNMFHLIALVTDRKIAFREGTESLIENVKFYNPSQPNIDVYALLLAVNCLPVSNFSLLGT